MTKQQIITDYLRGPRAYSEGVELYIRYGANLRLRQVFSRGESSTLKEMLIEELRKMAGLSPEDFKALRRCVRTSPAIPPEDMATAPASVPEKGPMPTPAPPAARKMLRFRERYPFLSSPECPDELKVLVADMFSAYDNYRDAHTKLLGLGDAMSAEAADLCRVAVENYLADREILDELNYYQEHGEILGKCEKLRKMAMQEDLSALEDMDLMGKLRSATSNVSKHRKTVNELTAAGKDTEKALAALTRWEDRKRLLESEVERRKKK